MVVVVEMYFVPGVLFVLSFVRVLLSSLHVTVLFQSQSQFGPVPVPVSVLLSRPSGSRQNNCQHRSRPASNVPLGSASAQLSPGRLSVAQLSATRLRLSHLSSLQSPLHPVPRPRSCFVLFRIAAHTMLLYVCLFRFILFSPHV